jgi:Leucine-rich repeat (LRR) protein
MKTKFTLVLLVLALSVCKPTPVTAQVDVQDSLALVDLYNSTDGPHWKSHRNWLTSMPVKYWAGIKVSEHRVWSINLSGRNLNGTIPSSLGNLTGLRSSLSLANNQLHGSIPPELGKIPYLGFLYLNNNQLTGSIPPELANSHIVWLHLENNQLSGTIPPGLGNFPDGLYLNNNQLTGSIPYLGIYLSELFLNDNQLSGRIPSYLGKIPYLRDLNLSDNQLSGNIPSLLGNDSYLENLYLNNNQLGGSIPVSLGKLTSLINLYLDSNQLIGPIPSSLGNLTGLVELNLKHNKLRDSIPSSLGYLTNLKLLRLSHNQLTGNIPSSFSNLQSLEILGVGVNNLSGSVPAFLTTLPKLHILWLGHNHYTFDGMEDLVQHPFDTLRYWNQREIPVHQNGNTLSVYAGGTLSNNTYTWFKDGFLVASIKGDSTFMATAGGNYNVLVTNAVATELTLKSDTVNFSALRAAQQNHIVANAIDKTGYSVYPNPVKDVLHLDNLKGNTTISIITQDGRMVDKKIVSGSSYAWNVKDLAAGSYYVRMEEDKGVTVMKFVKQ